MKKNGLSGTINSMATNTSGTLVNDTVHVDRHELVQAICGVDNENTELLEHHFHVSIRNKDEGFDIRGLKANVDATKRILEQLREEAMEAERPVKGQRRSFELSAAHTRSLIEHDIAPKGDTKTGNIKPQAIATRKATVVARTATQTGYMHAMQHSELVFGIGPAGTGKTYLAVAHAAHLLESGQVERIILTRPAVEAGERLGFLPGDMKEKVDPYLRPLYDALYDMFSAENVEKMITSGIIEIAPLAFMRGRTLTKAAVLLDEAQNTTTMQMKMFLTRLGEGSRMIITGDVTQVDLPRHEKSGLIDALQILDGVEGVNITRFNDTDVVRHALVGRIVRAYDKAGAKAPTTEIEQEFPLPESITAAPRPPRKREPQPT